MKKPAKERVSRHSPHKSMGLRHRWEALARSEAYARDYRYLHGLRSLETLEASGVIGLSGSKVVKSKDAEKREQIIQRMAKAGIVHRPNPELMPSILKKAKQKAMQECKASGLKDAGRHVRLLMERHLPDGNFAEGACVRLAPYQRGERLSFKRDGRYLRVELDVTADPALLRATLDDYLSAFGGQPVGPRKNRRGRRTTYEKDPDIWECYDRWKESGKTPHALAREDIGTTANAAYHYALHLAYKQFNGAVKRARKLIEQAYC